MIALFVISGSSGVLSLSPCYCHCIPVLLCYWLSLSWTDWYVVSPRCRDTLGHTGTTGSTEERSAGPAGTARHCPAQGLPGPARPGTEGGGQCFEYLGLGSHTPYCYYPSPQTEISTTLHYKISRYIHICNYINYWCLYPCETVQ